MLAISISVVGIALELFGVFLMAADILRGPVHRAEQAAIAAKVGTHVAEAHRMRERRGNDPSSTRYMAHELFFGAELAEHEAQIDKLSQELRDVSEGSFWKVTKAGRRGLATVAAGALLQVAGVIATSA